jgi:hypothetical protein
MPAHNPSFARTHRHYFDNTEALIWVVDSSQADHTFAECMLSHFSLPLPNPSQPVTLLTLTLSRVSLVNQRPMRCCVCFPPNCLPTCPSSCWPTNR